MDRGGSVMAVLLDDEIRGDWNNLKGTGYHLVYAVWLLLRGQASEVAFYRGNDLHARPIAPPLVQRDAESEPPIALLLQGAQRDVWIQLKATAEPWAPSHF